MVYEVKINNMVIHHWYELTNTEDKFSCDFWDCPHSINPGDKYYSEIYPNGHTMSYCLECSAFFMAQALNTLMDNYNKKDGE